MYSSYVSSSFASHSVAKPSFDWHQDFYHDTNTLNQDIISDFGMEWSIWNAHY